MPMAANASCVRRSDRFGYGILGVRANVSDNVHSLATAPGAGSGTPPAEDRRIAWRAVLFAVLVLGTMAAAIRGLAHLFAEDGGISILDMVLMGCFAMTIVWVVIGFWNAVIGLILRLTVREPAVAVNPLLRGVDPGAQIASRTAIVMPAFNEDPHRIFTNLKALDDSLRATGDDAHFDIHLLSDTQDPAVAVEEARRFARWRSQHPTPERLHYRRREDNRGHKTGNLWEFVERAGDRYDFMIVLDADSVMSGPAVGRMVRVMQARPSLGILQTLAVGLPSRSLFCRLFQYGMRQSMRPYTLGSAWWQGANGPYWGHNAILRVRAFRDHCRLPVLPGRAPLGGEILSHDQVEAVLMRRAGFEVRVLAEEGGSFEENPPTLPDFIKRDLRWCQGNMQYLQLLFRPGIRFMGRVQLLLAIWMYLAAPFWLAFMGIGLTAAILNPPEEMRFAILGPALVLYVAMMSMTFMPKLIGIVDILTRPPERRAYGGTRRILKGALAETALTMAMAPVVAVSQSMFVAGLFLGRRVMWTAQQRDGHVVGWADAAKGLWPQTLLGLVVTVLLAWRVPMLVPWASPVLLGLILAVPVAVLTSLPGPGRRAARMGLAALPEERLPTREVRAVRPTLPWTEVRARRAARLQNVPDMAVARAAE